MIKRVLFFSLKIFLFYSVIFIEFRNLLFDLGLFKKRKFSKKIISIGNLSMGGTGKTPVAEYLIQLLSSKYKVALLSRGYKSSNNVFYEIKEDDNPFVYGDEAVQVKKKNPFCSVFVCKNKIQGITKIIRQHKEIDIILLDDGYQKRSIKFDLNILLIDEKDYYDKIFPFGKLREPIYRYNRADLIIYTKSSSNISLKLAKQQFAFYSNVGYSKFMDFSYNPCIQDLSNYDCLAISGIAKPHYFNDFLKFKFNIVKVMNFGDHHLYKEDDVKNILHKYQAMKSENKVIIVTEKDYVKLNSEEFKDKFIDIPIYVLPIYFKFDDEKRMSKLIFKHVE